jgi:hypothetical protein
LTDVFFNSAAYCFRKLFSQVILYELWL